jgi:alkyl hydroperoxide reductase subunit AhpC
MRIGRSFNEVVRVIDALHPTARHEFVTPANWKAGDNVMNAGSVSDEDAKRQYPRGW